MEPFGKLGYLACLSLQNAACHSSIAMTAAHDSKLGSKLMHPITVEC